MDNQEKYSVYSFNVGDTVIFERTFNQKDYLLFKDLSLDSNPLHELGKYAEQSTYGQPIVPLHVTLAPLSYIAGMNIPGEPSLYLGHTVRALKPVYFGQTLRYSAKIERILIDSKTFVIQVLALCETEVVLEAELTVQARHDEWQLGPVLELHKRKKLGTALITGASGEIGSAIALKLAKQGWSLLLQDRGNIGKRESLTSLLKATGVDFHFISADLAEESGRKNLQKEITLFVNEIELVIHTASPSIDTEIEPLVGVNFTALKGIVEQCLIGMLSKQNGLFINIGSTAIILNIPKWENYAAAKVMSCHFMQSIDSRYSRYGIRGITIMPGFVSTKYSQEYRGKSNALIPEELAEFIIETLSSSPRKSILIIETNRKDIGEFSFITDKNLLVTKLHESEKNIELPFEHEVIREKTSEALAEIVRKILRLPSQTTIEGGGLGITSGWDSLSQIEIIITAEKYFGIQFNTSDISDLYTFDNILKKIEALIK
jgi:short-subunit dehydrogenase/acyl dehydratase/acyl carrier protein